MIKPLLYFSNGYCTAQHNTTLAIYVNLNHCANRSKFKLTMIIVKKWLLVTLLFIDVVYCISPDLV